MYEMGERLLPVDENDWDPLAVARLELRIAGDVDLVQLERDVLLDACEYAGRVLAEMAAGGAVEGDRVSTDRAHE
jgi:hypothetical protein